MRSLGILILFFVFTANNYSQNKADILVKIGNKVITVDEFKYRYEFTPQINRKHNDKYKAKEEFLYTLIAEKLFALAAEEKGFDTLSIIQSTYAPLEKMYVRDALYQKEIKDSIKFDNNMFAEGMRFSSFKLFVDYIYSEDAEKIKTAYSLLQANPNYDSLAPLLKNVEYVSKPYEVTYGKMFPQPEKTIYNLNIGEFTKPVQSPEGWYIFRLLNKTPVKYSNTNHKISTVKKVVEERIEDSIYNNFWNSFFEEKEIITDGSLFWYFVENLQQVIVEVKEKLKLADGEKITLTNENFIYLKNKMSADSLKKDFIKFARNPVTLESFVNDFMFEGFYTFTTDLNIIGRQLNSRLKRQIELELLARYGYEKGLESLPEVKSSTGIWKDNYLSTVYLRDFVVKSNLSQEDINKYLRKTSPTNFSETKFKIIEILTDSLDIVKKALHIAENDSLLKEFAKKHTKRETVKNNNGEFDYFTITEFEDIGKIVESMEVGDVYGPLQTKEGYSIFKLIGKKENDLTINGSAVDEDVKRKIHYKKIIDDLENKAVEFAEKYNVTVNESLLKSLNLQNTQMIVFKYMGFGGRILAFPYSSPFFKWKDKWEQKKKDLL